jgi:hypothetical protein
MAAATTRVLRIMTISSKLFCEVNAVLLLLLNESKAVRKKPGAARPKGNP